MPYLHEFLFCYQFGVNRVASRPSQWEVVWAEDITKATEMFYKKVASKRVFILSVRAITNE